MTLPAKSASVSQRLYSTLVIYPPKHKISCRINGCVFVGGGVGVMRLLPAIARFKIYSIPLETNLLIECIFSGILLEGFIGRNNP